MLTCTHLSSDIKDVRMFVADSAASDWTNTQPCLMPGFHHSVAILPLPFCRSVLPFHCAVVTFRCTVAVLPFRNYPLAGENGNTGKVYPYT